jgi:formylglycine-generating enzyme
MRLLLAAFPLVLLASCAQDRQDCAIPAGQFRPGNDASYPEERSGAEVSVAAFHIDCHEVTNADFNAFVIATKYVTLAERGFAGSPAVPVEQQTPGGAVFAIPRWEFVAGANWRHPDGPESNIAGRDTDPVVQVAYADALAYAKWKGRDLPTEAEWEWAASAGEEPASRDRPVKDGKPSANSWDGVFPAKDLGADGFVGRAPVASFPANANGLYDMTGNVWEWTKSEWRESHAADATGNPKAHAIKGGSFLCAQNFCARYRPESRQMQEVDLGTNHIGFRTVKRD